MEAEDSFALNQERLTMESFAFLPSSETSCIDASLSSAALVCGAMLGSGYGPDDDGTRLDRPKRRDRGSRCFFFVNCACFRDG